MPTMQIRHFFLAASLGVALLAACSKEEPAPAAATRPAGEAEKSAAEAAKVEAQKLIDQANQYIADHKLDLADSSLKKLEDMKDNLPADLREKITTLRQVFDAAKVGAASMPKMPGM